MLKREVFSAYSSLLKINLECFFYEIREVRGFQFVHKADVFSSVCQNENKRSKTPSDILTQVYEGIAVRYVEQKMVFEENAEFLHFFAELSNTAREEFIRNY